MTSADFRGHASNSYNSSALNRLRNVGYAALAAAGLYTAGCAAPNIANYRDHVRGREVDAALDDLIENQIGSCRVSENNTERNAVVAARRGLDRRNNRDRVQTVEQQGQPAVQRYRFHEGDYLWEWAVDENTHANTSTWYKVDSVNESGQITARHLVLGQVWLNQRSNRSQVTLYASDGSIARHNGENVQYYTCDIPRGDLQSRFYRALRNADVRSSHPVNRALHVAVDVTYGDAVQSLPVLDLLYPDAPNPFESGERDNVGGLAGLCGEAERTAFRHPFSAVGRVLRVPFRLVINAVRNAYPGLESRRSVGMAAGRLLPDGGDNISYLLLSLLEPLDRQLAGFFGLDRQLDDLVTGWDENAVDDQVATGIRVARRAALAAVGDGGSAAGVPGVPSGAVFSDGVVGR